MKNAFRPLVGVITWRLETPSEGWIYLHCEGGGSQVARFNLRWLLEGDETGDGTVPGDFSQ